jgi:EpsI family protein
MPEAVATRPAGLISKEQIWIAAAIAIVIYITLELADGFIALPLREMSSRISAWILNALSIRTVRTGTILSTENFTFDVVPACSGSTTLRVLLTLGAIWCAIHPDLTFVRRVICGLLVIPIALAANGARVAALVGLGDVFLKPVEGVPHAVVGLLGFALAMVTLYLLTEGFSARGRDPAIKFPLKIPLLCLAVLVLYAPVLIWMFNGLASAPLELVSAGVLFAVAVLFIRFWRRWPGRTERRWTACALFALSVFALSRAMLLDVRTVEGWCLVLTVFSLCWLFKGSRFALCIGPLLLAVPLTFPTVGASVARMISSVFGVERSIDSLLARLVASFVLALLSWRLFKRNAVFPTCGFGPISSRPLLNRTGKSGEPADRKVSATESASFTGPTREISFRASPSPAALNVAVFIAAIGVLFQTHFNSKAAGFDQEGQLELSYIQGDWVGVDAQVSDVAIEQIGRSRIISRRYQHDDDVVDVIVTTTGADRRRAHPPEWCMTGVGWVVQDRERVQKRLKDRDVPMTRMIFRKGDAELEFYYWFSDGQQQYASHQEMMREDLVRRLKGVRTNWMLLRVIAPKDNQFMDRFMSGLDPSLAKLTKGPA